MRAHRRARAETGAHPAVREAEKRPRRDEQPGGTKAAIRSAATMRAPLQPILVPLDCRTGSRSIGGVELTPYGDELLLIRVPSEETLAERAERLTPSERAVVALAVAGRSNGAIASLRGSSRRTIANQLAAAYDKLGLSGRRELRAKLRARGTP
jgi:DNA-binding CsgD family transcriptional regulator